MEMYELTPMNGRKSFYGKAKVIVNEDGSRTLLSYNTPIVTVKGNMAKRIFDGEVSCTTSTHIISFCGLHKKDFVKLPLNKFGEI